MTDLDLERQAADALVEWYAAGLEFKRCSFVTFAMCKQRLTEAERVAGRVAGQLIEARKEKQNGDEVRRWQLRELTAPVDRIPGVLVDAADYDELKARCERMEAAVIRSMASAQAGEAHARKLYPNLAGDFSIINSTLEAALSGDAP